MYTVPVKTCRWSMLFGRSCIGGGIVFASMLRGCRVGLILFLSVRGLWFFLTVIFAVVIVFVSRRMGFRGFGGCDFCCGLGLSGECSLRCA